MRERHHPLRATASCCDHAWLQSAYPHRRRVQQQRFELKPRFQRERVLGLEQARAPEQRRAQGHGHGPEQEQEQEREPVALVGQRAQLVALALAEREPLEVAGSEAERVLVQVKLGIELELGVEQGYAHDVEYRWG